MNKQFSIRLQKCFIWYLQARILVIIVIQNNNDHTLTWHICVTTFHNSGFHSKLSRDFYNQIFHDEHKMQARHIPPTSCWLYSPRQDKSLFLATGWIKSQHACIKSAVKRTPSYRHHTEFLKIKKYQHQPDVKITTKVWFSLPSTT